MPDETFEQRQARIAKQVEEQKRQEMMAAQQMERQRKQEEQKQEVLRQQQRLEAENKIKADQRFQQMWQMATDAQLRKTLHEYWKAFGVTETIEQTYKTVGWWIFERTEKHITRHPKRFDDHIKITQIFDSTINVPVGFITIELVLTDYEWKKQKFCMRFVWRENEEVEETITKQLGYEIVKGLQVSRQTTDTKGLNRDKGLAIEIPVGPHYEEARHIFSEACLRNGLVFYNFNELLDFLVEKLVQKQIFLSVDWSPDNYG